MQRVCQKKQERGAALFIAVIVLSILLATGLGVSTILIGQFRVLFGIEESLQAFFAADSGIERALYQKQAVSGTLSSGATYDVQFLPPGPNCPGPNYCLKSSGVFKNAERAVEVTR